MKKLVVLMAVTMCFGLLAPAAQAAPVAMTDAEMAAVEGEVLLMGGYGGGSSPACPVARRERQRLAAYQVIWQREAEMRARTARRNAIKRAVYEVAGTAATILGVFVAPGKTLIAATVAHFACPLP